MLLSVDVQYESELAMIGGVTFASWTASRKEAVYQSQIRGIEKYVPGEFFRRELPCILHLLNEYALKPAIIIVDGLVYLDGVSTPGLGKYLFDALEARVPVVGVAKSRFASLPEEVKVYRGQSKSPLYVTSVGIPLTKAKQHVASMHGKFRIPTMLKRADQIARRLQAISKQMSIKGT